jgi:hypothetical protein
MVKFVSLRTIPISFYQVNHLLIQRDANNSLVQLYSWFSANKLTLNTDKTCFTVFSNAKTKPSIKLTLNGSPISCVSASKYLGIHLDENLNWKHHTRHITSKLNQLSGAFYYLAKYINPKQIKQIYYAYVFPYIKYGIEIYGACDRTVMKPIQTAQNKILKILSKKEKRYPTNTLHDDLNLLKCEDIHNYFTGILVFKQQNGLLPAIFSNYFKKTNSIHRRHTRNSDKLFVPRFRLKCGQKSMKYTGVITWNSIPTNIRTSNSLSMFKRKYKSFLTSTYKQQT